MSVEPQFQGLDAPAQGTLPLTPPQAPSEQQLQYARALAAKTGKVISHERARSRFALSAWIDAHRRQVVSNRFAHYPSSKQVAFAERIARIKRREIPQECFRDKHLMARWIDSNKPR
ncbi:hypothetical protein So717_01520 [Roseobacter cerasinus]|uniref:Uncharacterized protein n=1 Tax=Roseobacter cerasinus TaxID=2602289 RepID=A0A640VJZ9_9RHOB|nr:hypothetical protein [Roseobacter cerasinus]GFE48399.1 hypothetical protein So717_01520 [Roseobacter cerasinus]